ncbi:MAG: hypothetical protein IJR33_08510 [Clostridia bacterium]|nr:hypothetical protein [Clostridia bacterium]
MISIYRGNNSYLAFQRANEQGIITTMPNNIYFTFKKSFEDTDFLFQKRYKREGEVTGEITVDSDSVWTVNILPQDTAVLEFGIYVCDVKVENESGLELTIVPPQKIRLAEVATHYNHNEE